MLLTPAWYDAMGPDMGSYGIFMLADLDEVRRSRTSPAQSAALR